MEGKRERKRKKLFIRFFPDTVTQIVDVGYNFALIKYLSVKQ